MRCPVCSSTVFLYSEDTREYYCAKCGYVASTIYSPTYVVNLRISNIYESQFAFNVDYEKIVDPEGVLPKTIQYLEKKVSHRKTRDKKILSYVYSYAEPLGINIKPDEALKLFKFLKGDDKRIPFKYLGLITVYIYAKQNGIPIDIDDLAKKFDIDEKRLKKILRKIIEERHIKLVPNVENYIYYAFNKYGIQEYMSEANEILNKIYEEVNGRKSKTIVALLIYILYTRHKTKKLLDTYKSILKEYKVADNTIRILYRLLKHKNII